MLALTITSRARMCLGGHGHDSRPDRRRPSAARRPGPPRSGTVYCTTRTTTASSPGLAPARAASRCRCLCDCR
jgi:hypothetical protein